MKHSAGIIFVTLSALVGTLLLTSTAARGRPPAPPTELRKYDLTQTEGMGAFVGSEAARNVLARNGFVVTGQQFRQIFAAYIGGALPKFITTDSSWHTYHVLLEEGVTQLEQTQVKRLKEFSRRLVDLAREAAQTGQGGLDDLAKYAAVGLALQDAAFRKTLPAKQAEMVQALRSKSGLIEAPLGFPLMPERFRAKSFYTKSSALTDYFAARQWYGVVALRLKSDRETVLAVKLAMLIQRDPELNRLWGLLSEPYDTLLARAEDGTVPVYADAAMQVLGKEAGLAGVDKAIPAIREVLAAKLSDPRVNDQLLNPAQYADFPAEIKGFRLLPPRRIPSAVCFQDTVDPKIRGRMFPSGLDLLVACKTLHSPAAKRALEGQCGKSVVEAVGRTDCGELPRSLHGEALTLLAGLQKPLPGAAPATLRTEAWQDKQLWTQLGAWAEQRHTWALHTKLTVHYLGMTREPAGMVSPYPEFFEGLGRLSRATARALDKAGVGKSLDVGAAATGLLDHIRIVRSFQQDMKKGFDEERQELLQAKAEKLERMFAFLQRYANRSNIVIRGEPEVASALDTLEKLASKCAVSGKASKEETAILKLFVHSTGEVCALLGEFADVCDKLAGIARKQLEGKELGKDDEAFIKGYGIALARFHFYGGNSWLTPRDDFPLVAPIFVSPIGNSNEILYAGLGRPQALYVIARAGGKPRLFRGAVMSYREFRRPADRPLDDDTWKALVKKGPVPPPPTFTRSFLAGITETEVVEILRSGKVYSDVDNVPGREITKAMVDLIGKGTHPDVNWLVEHLCPRCTEQDVGDLVALMAKVPVDAGLEELALTVAELPWKLHGDRLIGMLNDRSAKRADAAAYVLSRDAGQINIAQLVGAFDKQSIRTKRLYCFLLGRVPKADPSVKKVLLQAIEDKDDGLRWQAAAAIGRVGLGEDGVKALTGRIGDTNEFVASAAVQALARLKADSAAPAMLARLKKGVRPRNVTSTSSYRQTEAIAGSTKYGGRVILMVLRPRDGMFGPGSDLPSLGKALVEALGVLAHRPATTQLEAMLTGNYAPEAIEALRRIDPEHQVDRLVTLAFNRKADSLGREGALERLSELRSAPVARRLLPLLEETTAFPGLYNDKQWRVCDQAAQSIASLLSWNDSLRKSSEMEERAKLIAKIRQWAKTNQ